MPKFQKVHHQITALVLKTSITPGEMIHNAAVYEVAYNFARVFNLDNPAFDPPAWLDTCSPDTDQFPLSELWDRT